MIKINKPKITQEEIVDHMLEHMYNTPFKKRIYDSRDAIIYCGKEYVKKATNAKLYEVPQHGKIKGGATKADMVKLYEEHLVSKDKEARALFYNKILASAASRVCPYCGCGTVKTLDHYLAKSIYPVFAVNPNNLIPACRDCNSEKQDVIMKKKEDQHIHPYFDDYTTDIWIRAKMVFFEDDWFFTFHAEGPKKWSHEKQERVKTHFTTFALDENVYRDKALDRFPSLMRKIKRVYSEGGKKLAIEILKGELQDLCVVRINGWEQAMIRAVIQCEEFWKWFEIEWIKDKDRI